MFLQMTESEDIVRYKHPKKQAIKSLKRVNNKNKMYINVIFFSCLTSFIQFTDFPLELNWVTANKHTVAFRTELTHW